MQSIKFLHVTGASVEASFSPNETVADMKCRIFDLWRTGMPALEHPDQLRLIFRGKVLCNEELMSSSIPTMEEQTVVHMLVSEAPIRPPPPGTLVHIRSVLTGRNLKVDEDGTVHGDGGVGRRSTFVLDNGYVEDSVRFQTWSSAENWLRIRKSDAQLNGHGSGGTWCHWKLAPDEKHPGSFFLHNLITRADLRLNGKEEASLFQIRIAEVKASWGEGHVSSANKTSAEEWAEELTHFHGCLFDEAEVEEIQIVYDKHKNADGNVSVQDVWKFMQMYWRFMQKVQKSSRHIGVPFPKEHFKSTKIALIGRRMEFTKAEFTQFWFLFDNDAPNNPCPHGEKDRVQAAALELHRNLKPDTDFEEDVFDTVFNQVRQDEEQPLSCRQIELLYYMYSMAVSEDQAQPST